MLYIPSAESLAQLFRTSMLKGILCFGLFSAVDAAAPAILEDGIGILSILVVPLAIVLAFYFAWKVTEFSTHIWDPLILIAYPGVISFLFSPLLLSFGVFGTGETATAVMHVLVYVAGFAFLFSALQNYKLLIGTRIFIGILSGLSMGLGAIGTTVRVWQSAGWF